MDFHGFQSRAVPQSMQKRALALANCVPQSVQHGALLCTRCALLPPGAVPLEDDGALFEDEDA